MHLLGQNVISSWLELKFDHIFHEVVRLEPHQVIPAGACYTLYPTCGVAILSGAGTKGRFTENGFK